jgi:hypothetical protein
MPAFNDFSISTFDEISSGISYFWKVELITDFGTY